MLRIGDPRLQSRNLRRSRYVVCVALYSMTVSSLLSSAGAWAILLSIGNETNLAGSSGTRGRIDADPLLANARFTRA